MLASKRQESAHQLNYGECDMRTKLPSDPIINELHAIRQTLAAECNNDLLAIVKRAMKRQGLKPVSKRAKTGSSSALSVNRATQALL